MAMHEQIYIHFVCLKVIHKKKKKKTFRLMIFNVTLPLRPVTNRPIW